MPCSIPSHLRCGGLLLITMVLTAQDQVWTEPGAAAAGDPDFPVQGEYRHAAGGLQVAALGSGRFLVAELPGGLPGAGWDGKTFHASVQERSAVMAHLAKTKATPSARTSPTLGAPVPAGAEVLFTEGDAPAVVDTRWKHGKVADNLLCQGATTLRSYRDFRLHLEFRLPFKPQRFLSDQDRGNSGVYIFDRYEVQIIDTFGLHYGQAWQGTDGGTAWSEAFARDLGRPPLSKATQWVSALYLTQVPTVNATLPPLVWQTYDIDFTAPRFVDAVKTAAARISVRLNGLAVHTDLVLNHGTGQGGKKPELAEGPITLQEHANPVRFRNIWITPLP